MFQEKYQTQTTEISLYGYTNGMGKCGYCKLKNSSISFGIDSKKMLIEDYQQLMLLGWRRSG
jgi:hypothetical protein